MHSVAEQTAALAAVKEFPNLDVSHVDKLVDPHKKHGRIVIPEGFDRLAVFPKHSVLARYAIGNEDWPVYNRALAHAFTTLKVHRPNFVDYTQGRIGPEYERMTQRTRDVFDELEKLPGDFHVLAVQTGILYRDKSVADVRASFDGYEFGLDSVSAASILLVHPERLTRIEDLAMDCPGSERAPEAVGQFVRAPYFFFGGGRLRFVTRGVGDAYPLFGSASALLPE